MSAHVIVGMIGNVTVRGKHYAAEVRAVLGSRVVVAVWATHSDRIFKQPQLGRARNVLACDFIPVADSLQPVELRTALANTAAKRAFDMAKGGGR